MGKCISLFHHDQGIFSQEDLVRGHPKLISTGIVFCQRYNLKWPEQYIIHLFVGLVAEIKLPPEEILKGPVLIQSRSLSTESNFFNMLVLAEDYICDP